jgi:hypothetical protein
VDEVEHDLHGDHGRSRETIRLRRQEGWFACLDMEYEITPRTGGCQVTERTFDQRPLRYRLVSFVSSGLRGRSVRNRQTMEQTLDALARAVES